MTGTPALGEDGSLPMNEQQKLAWKIGGVVIAGLMIAGVVSCSSGNDAGDGTGGGSVASGTPASKLDQLGKKVGQDAVMPMTRADFSKTYAKLGKVQFDNANALMRWAALAAAESDKCDKVEMVAVSDGATRKRITFYADCANGERFMVDEGQARATRDRLDPAASADARKKAEGLPVAEPKSARWAKFNETSAVTACDLLTQQAMLVPGSFSTGWSRWAIDKNDDTGIVTIERDFKSENSYSMKINGRYRCILYGDEGQVKSLSIREPSGWRKLI